MSSPLPILAVLPALREVLARAPSAVLTAEPGAGKTTGIPLALLHEPWLRGKSIVMLEPRRLAARAAARHMAQALGEEVGQTVGYTVRLERRVSSATRIEIVTEGILTRRLQSDPMLERVGLLIFDEFHERSLDADLALALALEVQSGLREDLKILVMSATLDEERLSTFLGDAPVLSSPGRQYPVETRYGERTSVKSIAADVVRAVRRAHAETAGGMLVFLPGEAEIRQVAAGLDGIGADLMPLYGSMPAAEQDRAIRPAEAGRRKLVLATTIAETSLTIDGIEVVIDCGYKRRPRFDPGTGMTALETVRVSLASADQRRGRAGRLGPGICYRLWPEEETRALPPFDPPEILAADLASLTLELAVWGVSDPAQLRWLDPPPPASFAQARQLLRQLDALDATGGVTERGKAMASLPLHPRLACMVLAGKELGAGALAADLASLLAERDILGRDQGADIALRLEALRGERAVVTRGAKERIREAARQIRQIARISGGDSASAGVLVGLAFPDRLARARGGHGRFLMAGGGGAVLDSHDSLAACPFLAIASTDGRAGDQRVFLAAEISADEIEQHFTSAISVEEWLAWDDRQKQVVASLRRKLGAIILDERQLNGAEPDRIAAAMCDGVAAMGLASLPWSEGARRLRHRTDFLRRLFPEAGWPELGDEALLASLESWLKPYLAGMTRAQHLARLDMHRIMQDQIPPALRHELDRLAPSRLVIPSGREVTIDYEGGGGPVLRARIQEMFGLAETPRVAGGRVPLRIELLSPAGRPLAVTQSLETFWTNVYPSVRAEMRGRYPKHAWPENPLSAPPLRPKQLR